MRPRVTLRPLSEDDVPELSRWYKGDRPLEEHLKEARADAVLGLLAITVAGEGEPIGLLEYRAGVPEDGWLAFGFVAVEPGLRGLGFESEAVRLLEEGTLERGLADRFWVGVRHSDGLGLYFWLRLGYRPARPGEGRWPGDWRNDIIVMARISENPPRT